MLILHLNIANDGETGYLNNTKNEITIGGLDINDEIELVNMTENINYNNELDRAKAMSIISNNNINNDFADNLGIHGINDMDIQNDIINEMNKENK